MCCNQELRCGSIERKPTRPCVFDSVLVACACQHRFGLQETGVRKIAACSIYSLSSLLRSGSREQCVFLSCVKKGLQNAFVHM